MKEGDEPKAERPPFAREKKKAKHRALSWMLKPNTELKVLPAFEKAAEGETPLR